MTMRSFFFRSSLLLFLLFLAACAEPRQYADETAKTASLRRGEVQAGPFVLTFYGRIRDQTGPLVLYIEGDGFAWRNQYEPSSDPSPTYALGLALAAADPYPNVFYLARPCQFTPLEKNPICEDDAYWTDRRFSEEVIAAMNEAISRLSGGRVLHLVGVSGGGGVAVLIAARRHDVASIRTIAGNLDHVALNNWHEVSPMLGSLNAIDKAAVVAKVPQIHFVGAEDDIVPPFVAERFRKASASSPCVRIKMVKGCSHEEGWAEHWRTLLRERLSCR